MRQRAMILKDLLEYLAKSLVDDPDEVHVQATETDTTVVLELSVGQGRRRQGDRQQGRIARALRTVVGAAAAGDGQRVVIDIVD